MNNNSINSGIKSSLKAILVLGVILCNTRARASLLFELGHSKDSDKVFSVGLLGEREWFVYGGSFGIMPRNDLFGMHDIYIEGDVGVQVRTDYVYMRVMQGVAIFSRTRYGIATRCQLPITVSAGIVKNNYSLGIFWKHFSNGTNNSNNTGLEFIGVEFGY